MSHQPELPGQPDNRLTIRPKAVVGVVIAVLALVFIFQNAGKGRIEFLFWSVSMPAWIWLLVIFVARLVTGSLFPWLRGRPTQP